MIQISYKTRHLHGTASNQPSGNHGDVIRAQIHVFAVVRDDHVAHGGQPEVSSVLHVGADQICNPVSTLNSEVIKRMMDSLHLCRRR